ncbi:SUMF1/EgtB/PvdO family nonheme iron enzyme [Blastopirellula sp. JC732]|uniref:non-specific serine/threonine protein kinase n=1 Tax=Blastopirellula sediminis TaxID=2894196 RepID=A0A9X1MKK3_9BACT|nr:SUMF1/EgtB/PvdO family nonheme iron enzyme [Blastopirellula sediminis]MCC9608370.1 SUMF1/EgtB/PvdO family nonheme iron enzyme [Blastopirellula sediminis]MCC9628853.1 SUMF1/EgtB/PvdO family nonheme iron enzyme [Blastopirellula sediminis]
MDERLLDLLLQWEEAASSGTDADLAKLADGDPQLLEQLQQHVAALQKIAWLDAPQAPAEELHLPTAQSLHSSLLMPDDLQLKTLQTHLAAAEIIPPAKLKELLDSHRVRTGFQLAGLLLENDLVTRFQLRSIANGKTRGLKLGRYVVLDKIGEGGMGQVYKARHSKMGRVVALKVLPRAAMAKSQSVERFNQEMKVAAKLRHENIVTAYDADESDGIHFFVMEYVEGRDLNTQVRRAGPLSVAAAVDCLLQAAQGLEYAHGVGLVHRDIKPANLLIDQNGVVKILDMGIARIQTDSNQSGLTQNGAVMGTVDFMAPEQAVNAKAATASADLYSLGCSLYYLLTGRPPFGGETLMVKLLGHREQTPPSLLNVRRDVPPALQAIYEKCMAKSPADRYKSATELIAALRRIRPQLSDAPPALSISSMETANDTSPTAFFETQPYSADAEVLPTRSIDARPQTSLPTLSGRGVPVYGGVIGALVLLFGFLYYAAGILFPSAPPLGTLVVEVDQEDLTAHLRDQELAIVDLKTAKRTPIRLLNTEQTVSLAPGEYKFDLDASGAIKTDVSQLTILSDASSKVHLFWKEAAKSTPPSVPETAVNLAPAMAIAPFDQSQAKAHQAAWASYLGVPELSTNSVGITFRVIPPGEFVMGSPQWQFKRLSDETEHEARISRPYLMSDTEVTRKQWDAVMGPRPWNVVGSNSIRDPLAIPASPITWEDATEFCRRLSEKEGKTYRLPTEAEWEFACRAGAETAYSFGDDQTQLVNYAWFNANALNANEQFPHPVRQKLPNPFGLYDMPGNVWEWCSDWYGSDYFKLAPLVDPTGPNSGPYHVQRGGSWYYGSDVGRSAARSVYQPEKPEYIGGFRIVQAFPDVPAQSPPKAPSPTGAYALEFDGVNDYVKLPFGYKGEHPLTMEVVLQVPAPAPGLHNILGTSEDSGVRFEFAGHPDGQTMAAQIGLAKPSRIYQMVSSQNYPPPGTTVNLTATIDSQQFRLFIDGKKVAESTLPETDRLFNDLNWIVGASPNLNQGEPLPVDFPFCGVIQQVRLSNAVLYQEDFKPTYQFDSSPQTMALYQFKEGQGTQLTDSSGHNRHGAIYGDPQWIPLTKANLDPNAHRAFALEFDGVDDYVELPYPFDLPAPWSLEMVAVTPTNPTNIGGALFSTTEFSGLGWTLSKTKTDGFFNAEFLIHSSRHGAYIGLTAKDITPPDTPVNFTVVSDKENVRYYVDGSLVGNIAIPEAERNYGDLKAMLGASPSQKPNLKIPIRFPFRGKIQQFRISTSERFTSEFTPQYQFAADDETYAFYDFKQGEGAELTDVSGHNRHGVIHGDPQWVRLSPDQIAPPTYAIDFDGVDDFVELPFGYQGKTPITVEVVLPMPLNSMESGTIFGNTEVSGVGLGINRQPQTGKRIAHLALSSTPLKTYAMLETTDLPTTGTLTNLTFVLGPVEYRLYVDGKLAGKAALPESERNHSRLNFLLGASANDRARQPGDFDFPYRGQVQQVRVSMTERYESDFTPQYEFFPDDDTFALYRFTEASGTILHDSSGNHRNGEIHGNPRRVKVSANVADGVTSNKPLRRPHGMEFDGVDDRVMIPISENLVDGPLTIEFFCQTQPGNSKDSYFVRAITHGDSRTVCLSPNGKLYAAENKEDVYLIHQPCPYEKWVHVAATFADRPLIFVDGQKSDLTPNALKDPRTSPAPDSLVFGGDMDFSHMFAGKIGGVRISKSLRYQDNFTPPTQLTKDADTLALYLFEEGSGTQLLDSSGNNHHGKIEGNPQWLGAANATSVDDSADRRAAEYVLSIGGQVRINDDSHLGTNTLIKNPNQLPNEAFRLTHVELANNNEITDQGLSAFQGTSNLRRVKVLNSSKVTAAGLAHLAENRSITFLELWGCQLTSNVFSHLQKMDSVIDFRFGYNSLNDDDMQFFREFPSTPRLRCLMLSNTSIGDEGIACLADARELRQLNVNKTSLTDKSFDTFLNLPLLQNLHLTETKVTPAGVAKFKQARPTCRVVWDGDPTGAVGGPTTSADSPAMTSIDPTPSAPPPGPGVSAVDVFTSGKWRWSKPEPVVVAGVEDSETLCNPYLLDKTGELYFAISPERLDKADLAVSKPATPSGTWEKPTLLSSEINSSELEHGPRLFADGTRMLFHSRRTDGMGQDDIWIARRNSIDEPFGRATNLGSPINTDQGEAHAAITNDGLTLVFERQRVEGRTLYGTLMIATRKSIDAPFDEPVPLENEINAGVTNTCPAISPDGTVLLFSSFRTGYQGLNLFVCNRASTDQPFGPPVLFDPVFPTGSWKIVTCVSQDLTRIFMSHSQTPQQNSRLWQCRLLTSEN